MSDFVLRTEKLTKRFGGLIAVDRKGNVAAPFSSTGFYRGVVRPGRAPEIAIYRK